MKEERNLTELLERYMDQEGAYRMEGEKGLENLCLIANTLGYKDSMHRQQLRNGCCLYDLVELFEDCPGALQAVVDWIGKQNLPEWREKIKAEIMDDEDDDDEDTGSV